MGVCISFRKRTAKENGAGIYPFIIEFKGDYLFATEKEARDFMRALDELTN